jgi:hypothetical protein
MMNDTIVVCGDSFMSPVIGKYANTHFSELLAKKLGYELVCLSRGGASNGAICLQITEAIKLKPSLILYGITSSDRIEVNATSDPYHSLNRPIDIRDVIYSHSSSLSSRDNSLNITATLISDTLLPMLDTAHPSNIKTAYASVKDIDMKADAIKQWFTHMYHAEWKRQQDSWMLYAVVHLLHSSGIPYVKVHDLMQDTVPTPEWSTVPGVVVDNELFPVIYDPSPDAPMYHTSPESQLIILEKIEKILADTYNIHK